MSSRHSHLPMLADVAAISYDPDEGTVERGDRFGRFAHYLRADE